MGVRRRNSKFRNGDGDALRDRYTSGLRTDRADRFSVVQAHRTRGMVALREPIPRNHKNLDAYREEISTLGGAIRSIRCIRVTLRP